MTTPKRTVELIQGNDTLRGLMSDVLRDVGLTPQTDDVADAPCDLLVADVDSGAKDVEQRIALYRDAELPVLLCGLRVSRERHGSESHWIERPFALGNFVVECLDLLGVAPDESTAPSTLYPDSSDVHDDDERDSVEVDTGNLEEIDLDEDSSMILAIEELQVVLGGVLNSGVSKRRIDSAEIRLLREHDVAEEGSRPLSVQQTMPDTPIAINSEADETSSMPAVESAVESTELIESGMHPIVRDPTTRSELTTQIRGVARMLAQSWQRIALTARTDDRAERIERVLVAAVNTGLRGASEEVQRIPPSVGFAGGLQAMTLIDVLRTIRDRRLRGRLELAIGDDAYVLHCDGVHLDGIDVLTGSVDDVLLDILYQGGEIAESQYEELRRGLDGGEIFDLEMTLQQGQYVSDAALSSARVVRGRELFRQICGTRGGQFAFLEVQPGDGQTWPIDAMRINVDELLLQILRETSIDTGDSKATARTRLMTDPNRAAHLTQNRLTELERSVLTFFQQGETLAEARQRLEKLAGKDAVDEIVDRLKKLELLRRSEPSMPPPALGKDEKASTGNTVVSALPESISDVERRHRASTLVNETFDIDMRDGGFDDVTIDTPEETEASSDPDETDGELVSRDDMFDD